MKRTEYQFTPQYLTKNNQPWFPLMGEIHYSRYPQQLWKDALDKMKTGGIDIVSTYAFWIHHEEIEGEYDFSGQRDLRAFVKTVKECGLSMFLRIGPWCHGEVRNGGFPDWLLQKDFEPRTNEEAYFDLVGRYYKKLYDQIEGYLHKDGGPIIGIQVENEYGHAGGLTGEAGESHMRRLKQLAQEAGFLVPYYTATGWGGAVTGGMLPVMGGYCEAPWDQRITEIEPSGNYIFTHERNDHNIGSDYGFGTGITFDMTKFPFLTAELGGGLQVTKHRRPIATGADIGAMSMVKLGCGVNLLGYYMYHGGTNPKGKLTTLEESKETGYPSDLPKYSYDFAAPIREYGQISDTYKEIKLLAMFLHDFGTELCKMPAYIPEDNPKNPKDTTGIRSSVRRLGKSGYVFINNYQKNQMMREHKDIELSVDLPDEEESLVFPKMTIKNGEYYFYPFYMDLGNATLIKALATPLCKLIGEETTFVFYGEKDPMFEVSGNITEDTILWIPRDDAKDAWKISLDRDYLLITNATVMESEEGYELRYDKETKIKTYPKLTEAPEGFLYQGMDGRFAIYVQEKERAQGVVSVNCCEENSNTKCFEVKIEYTTEEMIECYLSLSMEGESLTYFINGELIGDWFYTGIPMEIELVRFGCPNQVEIVINALHEGDQIYLEKWPKMEDGIACGIKEAKLKPIYHTRLKGNLV